ncbi:MAG: DUF1501 domain-containing protein [Saprospiraceae bacterium]
MKRRDFLKIFGAGGAAPFVVNGHALRPFANSRIARMLSSCDGVNDRALVLIQLKGGNDGLNTIIPIAQYDAYANLRPVIKVPINGPGQMIPLDNTLSLPNRVGLHPAMTGIKALYDKGWVRIVQGVGYENINQSHFKGTDLWLSGGDSTPEKHNLYSGWFGRALQAMYPYVKGEPHPDMEYPLGIQIGDPYPSLGFHSETEHQNSINLYGQDPDGFYSLVQTIGGAPLPNIPDSDYGDEIRYILGVEKSVDTYSEKISEAFKAGSNHLSGYPNHNDLANQLKTVARLIKGGCKTRIYLCNLGGFDTHGNQLEPEGDLSSGGHGRLLGLLSEAVKFFFDDLQGLGLADRVLACTFSEFGRTARENGAGGTDHGTLAPMFVFGKNVAPGIEGTNVNLSNLAGGDQLQGMQYDYRQVFATLLQDWLGGGVAVMQTALFEGFNKLPLLAPQAVVEPDCYVGDTVSWSEVGVKRRALQVFPNPAVTRVEVSFYSDNAFPARLSLHSLGGALVSLKNAQINPGLNLFWLDVSTLHSGPYFVRIESALNGRGEVAKLQVVNP